MKLHKLFYFLFTLLLISGVVAMYYEVNIAYVALVIFTLAALLSYVKLPEGVALDMTVSDTTYAGEVLEGFISLATTTFETLEKGCINILPGIKKKKTIPSVKVTNFIQARKATPNHGGNVGIGARTLEPLDFMGYLEFNPRDLEAHWVAVQMNPKLLDAMLPRTVESAIIQEIFKLNKNYLDYAVWQSVYDAAAITTALSAGLGDGDNNLIFFDGLLKKMLDDATVIDVPLPVALTAANIISKFEEVKALVPEAVYKDPRFKFIVSDKTGRLYGDAQKAQANKGVDVTSAGKMEFDGKPVVTISGVPDDTIVACKASRDLGSNLWMGVNAADEDEYLKLARLQANSELYFIKMLYKIDVNHAYGEETVLYTTFVP